MGAQRVAVVGAGMAGLVAALELAAHGFAVTVLERAPGPGGKMREVEVEGARVDGGPTVLTLRGIFEEIFADAGTSLDGEVTLRPLEVLARHAWSERERLDLFADRDRSADAVGAFAGAAEARRFRAFCEEARAIYRTLEGPFIRAARPSLQGLVGGVGLRGLGELWRIRPFATLWQALGEHFRDPRLRQLFGRYATYCGSSPFLAPATLMLVAHVELEGVWTVAGGMHRLARALERVAERRGAAFRYGAEVEEILVRGGRIAGVRLAGGEVVEAEAVVLNADVEALAKGRLGPDAADAVPAPPPGSRSLSAVTWAFRAEARGFPLLRHNVFFSRDYPAEFADIFERHRLPAEPTVYICAQDRHDRADEALSGAERLFCLVNAPPTGDTHPFPATEIEACEDRMSVVLERCGLRLDRQGPKAVTTPAGFERLFPGTGGALYGRASHGWRASFERPHARTRLPGLYLAGGSVHPGPGVPMAALSGRTAAALLRADLASTGRSRRAATPGGTSTR